MILRVLLLVRGDPKPLITDLLKHEGAYWIVSGWWQSNDKTHRRPRRMVCISNLRHQLSVNNPFVVPGLGTYHAMVNTPIPKELLDPDAKLDESLRKQYLVLENPDIQIRESPTQH
jgi:hypothetical protein